MNAAADSLQRLKNTAHLSGPVLLLGLVSLCNDLASEMIYPLLPVFLSGIGATAAFIGIVEGVAESTASLTKLFSGSIADRLQRKRTLTAAGYLISNLVRPLIGLSTAGWHVLLLRFSDRLGKGIRTAPRDAIIADNTPAELRGRAFGFNRAMDHGGAMGGAALAFALLTWAGASLQTVFLLSAIPGALAALFVIAGVGVARDPAGAASPPPALSLSPPTGRFRLFLGILALFALGNSSDAFLLLRANQLGIPSASLPLVWILFHAVKSSSSIPGGVLSDKLGRPALIVSGWAVYAAVYIGFCAATAAWHAYLLFAAYGLFFGLTEGVEKAFVADLVPSNRRGCAFGVYHFVLGVIAFPASVLCGYLWQEVSSRAALGAGAILAASASLLMLSCFRRGFFSQPAKAPERPDIRPDAQSI